MSRSPCPSPPRKFGPRLITFVSITVLVVAAAVLWAGGIVDEAPATAAERRMWPADVVEDDGSYDD